MDKITWICVDAMGGDNAPAAPVAGAVGALSKSADIGVILSGRREDIQKELSLHKYDAARLKINDATEVIGTGEPPVEAVRGKPDSSLVSGLGLLKSGEAQAMVSCGSTGAVLVASRLIVGKIQGIHRTPIGALIPTQKGVALLVDSGANVDSRGSHLVQYSLMGSIYMENVLGIKNPRVGLVNVGVEEEKGNALSKEAHELLKQESDINFIGNIEACDIPRGAADVIVCDAFVGNVILKLYEGTAGVIISMLKEGLQADVRSKIGALMILPSLKKTLKSMDASQYGGAPLLGLKALVVKAHGSSGPKEITNALLQCLTFKEQGIAEKIAKRMGGC